MSSSTDGDASMSRYEDRVRQLDDQMLDSSRRSRQTLDETVRMGADIMVELDDQGQKLTRTERRLDNIDQDLRTSQRTIREIRSVFGGVVNWFTKDKLATTPSTASSQQTTAGGRGDAGLSQAAHSAQRSTADARRHQQQQQEKKTYRSAQEQEVDQNLAAMSDSLAVLQSMGTDMGNTLQAQNDQIDRMSGRVLTLDDKVRDLNKQQRRLL